MEEKRYRMSFTTGGLFLYESLETVRLFRETNSWETTKRRLIDENLLQVRTQSTAKRISQEIILRLKTLNDKELRLLVDGEDVEQKYLLWIGVCRLYRFIKEFAVEVIREHYLSLNQKISPEDFETFFEDKAQIFPELNKISLKTRQKLKQVLFRLLREAELIDRENTIVPAIFTPKFLDIIPKAELVCFPHSESTLNGGKGQ